MEMQQSSTTAWAVAMARVAHVKFDAAPPIFDDSLALKLIEPTLQPLLEFFKPSARVPDEVYRSRPYLAWRQRYQEECLAAAYQRGVRQYVILGAGLDSYAFRQPGDRQDLTIYEVDFPATQTSKRDRIAALGWPWPDNLAYVACDFAEDSLATTLTAGGLDPARPCYFAWMGVTVYLARETVHHTLRQIRRIAAPGSSLALEYAPPTEQLSGSDRACREFSLAQETRIAEPFCSYFTEREIAELLETSGFIRFVPLDHAATEARLMAGRSDQLSIHHGFRLAEARV